MAEADDFFVGLNRLKEEHQKQVQTAAEQRDYAVRQAEEGSGLVKEFLESLATQAQPDDDGWVFAFEADKISPFRCDEIAGYHAGFTKITILKSGEKPHLQHSTGRHGEEGEFYDYVSDDYMHIQFDLGKTTVTWHRGMRGDKTNASNCFYKYRQQEYNNNERAIRDFKQGLQEFWHARCRFVPGNNAPKLG